MQATAAPSLWRVEGGRLIVSPHPGQQEAWDSDARFTFVLAGTQGGKTSFGPLWLWREIQRRGAGDYLGVTSTFPLLKLKMLPEFLRVFRDALALGEWHASDRVFAFSRDGALRTYGSTEPTRVIFGSATNSESLESATAKAAWLDEVGQDDFRLESWEAILRRLALHLGRVLGGTTLYNLGWLKQQVYDRWQAGDPDYRVVQFDSTLNPIFPREEYERAKATLPAWKFDLFYRARYSRPAGAIYDCFVDAYREHGGHKVRPFAIPPSWPRHAGVDFGAVNLARVWVAHDPEADVFYLYRESLEGGKTTAEHAAAAKDEADGLNVRTWHGGAKSETQQRIDWHAQGVPLTEPLVADVEAGIDRVYGLFKTWRLYVFDTCAGTLDELGTYAREVDALGVPTAKIKDKEKFHRLDALRYLSAALLRLPRPPPQPYGYGTPGARRAPTPQERLATLRGKGVDPFAKRDEP